VEAVSALTTDDQLALSTSPDLRPVGALLRHIIGARVRWFTATGEGGADIAPLGTWDRPNAPTLTPADLVKGLHDSWQLIKTSLDRWTQAELEQPFDVMWGGKPYTYTRQWIVWHVLEHDLHHGGELSYVLGSNGLKGLDL
jgi:uncharacterized damage-inducible protein DinB